MKDKQWLWEGVGSRIWAKLSTGYPRTIKHIRGIIKPSKEKVA